jgi:predicted anti-sigma-YlaC factor YlaD
VDCAAVREVLERYVDARLGAGVAPAGTSAITAHLGRCAACRADHEGLLAVTLMTGALTAGSRLDDEEGPAWT